MHAQSITKKWRTKRGVMEEQSRNLFPEIFNISSLKTDPSLPIVKFKNFRNEIRTKEKFISLKVKLPALNNRVDLYLFLNKKKHDMFYQIHAGEYEFKNIELKDKENLLEIFYRTGMKKSIPSCSVILKEGE